MVWHLKRKHKLIVETIPKSNDPERFKCSYCGKIFTQGRGLKDHINTHTGAKPYMCNYCGAAFASHGTWRMHERTVHLGHKRDESAHVKAAELKKSIKS